MQETLPGGKTPAFYRGAGAAGGGEQTHGGTTLEIPGTEGEEEGNALLQRLQGLSGVLDWTHGFRIHQQVSDALLKLKTPLERVTHPVRHTGQVSGPTLRAPVGRE